MRRKIGFALVAFMLFFAGASHAAQMTKPQLQQMYMSYLAEQGYQPDIDSDGDVVFKSEGMNFYIPVDEDDLESFRIVFPNFWKIESSKERIQVSEAAMYATRTTKVARVYITSNEDTTIDANIFIESPEDFKIYFRRMLDVILVARRDFRDKMED